MDPEPSGQYLGKRRVKVRKEAHGENGLGGGEGKKKVFFINTTLFFMLKSIG